MQNYLAFAKIDQDIWNAVSNMGRVSARAADTILALSKKSLAHKKAIIEIAEEIRKGAGTRRIEKLVNSIINTKGRANNPTLGKSNWFMEKRRYRIFRKLEY
jgi:hypothetical protein